MNVTESFTYPKKGGQENNEDALFVGQRFIAVVDGVTSKTAAPANAQTSGGCFASRTVCKLLEEMPDITDAEQILNYLNENLKKAISQSLFAGQLEPPAASLILYDAKTGCIISYGDCQAILRGKVYKREKKLDVICAKKRSRILHDCLQKGQTEEELLKNDAGRKAIEPDILDSFLKYANREADFGFPVLGTGTIIPAYIDVYPVKAGEEVVLASDGYPALLPTLAESERELAKIIREDPLLICQYKATKGVLEGNYSYDDRTYIRFTV